MISRLKTIFILIVAAAIIAPALYAGGNQESADPVRPAGETDKVEPVQAVALDLQIGVLKGPSGFGIIKLMEENPSFGENVTTEYTVTPSPAEMIAKLTSGELQAGLLPLNVAAKLYTKGAGYPLAAVPGRGNLFILSRDPEVHSLRDLEGKKLYATGKGATPDYVFTYLANEAGVDLEKVDVDFTYPHNQLAQMGAAGQMDTVLVPQPFASLIMMKNKEMEIRIDLQEEWMTFQDSDETYPMTAFVFSPEVAAARPEVLENFLVKYEESINWVLANVDEAAAAIERQGILAAGPAKAAIPFCGLDYAGAPESRVDVEAFLTVLLESNPQSVGGTLPDDGFYLAP
ncbi:MAG: ABC transporter substrate-binding protein [Spirochaetales bacterium]|nr:ABC transporter substrate-binding protein [Spirochaetales bacterium]